MPCWLASGYVLVYKVCTRIPGVQDSNEFGTFVLCWRYIFTRYFTAVVLNPNHVTCILAHMPPIRTWSSGTFACRLSSACLRRGRMILPTTPSTGWEYVRTRKVPVKSCCLARQQHYCSSKQCVFFCLFSCSQTHVALVFCCVAIFPSHARQVSRWTNLSVTFSIYNCACSCGGWWAQHI